MMKSLFTILFIGLMVMVSGQNVGINDDGSSPASGAILDVKSSSKGLLIPRTTIASITSPSEGMLIYDTSKKRFMLHTGSNWYELMTEEDSGPFERDGTTLKQKGNYTDDLLFGTSSINSATISPYDRLIYFDQFRGAFRGGQFEDPSYLNSLGLFSFAYGGNTKADGGFSFAIGSTTTASGSYSFAGGRNTSADGYASFSMGNNVSAPSAYETQLGVYGKSYTPSSSTSWVGTDRLFSIGNGTFTGVNSSNALTILKNGKLGIGEVDPGARLHVNADVGEHLLKLEEDNSDKLTFRLNPQGDLIYDTETTNTLIGNDAGEMMSSGTMNVMLGKSAGRDVSGYSDNVFIGGESGLGASGEMNTFLGRGAGSGSTGSRNVFLGHSVGYFKSGSDQLH
ncbi:MAG: hypothetical protein HKN68_16285, partial [Saprospiraceae bacterium]|nr:hypothetical protein [Saprospiraceae bacterium]